MIGIDMNDQQEQKPGEMKPRPLTVVIVHGILSILVWAVVLSTVNDFLGFHHTIFFIPATTQFLIDSVILVRTYAFYVVLGWVVVLWLDKSIYEYFCRNHGRLHGMVWFWAWVILMILLIFVIPTMVAPAVSFT